VKLLITGGCGFIGSALIRHLLSHTAYQVVNLDKLTYAANPAALTDFAQHPHYSFICQDICNPLDGIFTRYQPDAVIHLAAETHVDNSLRQPNLFIQTNIHGTANLLEATRHYWQSLNNKRQAQFRFLQVSTDEVFGDLATSFDKAKETHRYAPSSPYAASKAAADHLARAWQRSFGLPIIISHCTNNYGPWQHKEKLIPRCINLALQGKPLPIYGNGKAIRDWLYVEDHIRALVQILEQGRVGETYNIGANCEKTTLEVVNAICQALEKLIPEHPNARSANNPQGFAGLIQFVQDRPGHDLRYALNSEKIQRELNWQAQETFENGIDKTVQWYLNRLN